MYAVRGLTVDGFGYNGVAVLSSHVIIAGNYIVSNGQAGDLFQGDAGVALYGSSLGSVALDGSATNNTVGGTDAGARNVISGNGIGVWISGPGATGNLVEGNYIGTDATGTTASWATPPATCTWRSAPRTTPSAGRPRGPVTSSRAATTVLVSPSTAQA